jgi:hypothetical protein
MTFETVMSAIEDKPGKHLLVLSITGFDFEADIHA